MHNKSSANIVSGITILVNSDWCKRCGICSAFCPAGVYETDDFGLPSPVHAAKCTMCMMCVVLCPDFAIEVLVDRQHAGDASGKVV
jgi:2-oxoglutarate ferredoxin oxidoreductase subunit delta